MMFIQYYSVGIVTEWSFRKPVFTLSSALKRGPTDASGRMKTKTKPKKRKKKQKYVGESVSSDCFPG